MAGSMRIKCFDFEAGKKIAGKYKIIEKLGSGWEGEVYKIEEFNTQIIRAAKFFFPHRNIKNKESNKYAKKLHKLSNCPLVIQYHNIEFIQFKGFKISCLISEFVEGEILSEFIKNQKNKKLDLYSGLQLLHNLVTGLEDMHRFGEYHGDLHSDNIIVKRYGLGFQVKLLDMYDWKDGKVLNRMEDIVNSIKIFVETIGGKKQYSKLPREIKEICLGLRKDLILQKFKTASQLRGYIENINWN